MMDPDREKTGKVMQAMTKMQKIIIADLEAAYSSLLTHCPKKTIIILDVQ